MPARRRAACCRSSRPPLRRPSSRAKVRCGHRPSAIGWLHRRNRHEGWALKQTSRSTASLLHGSDARARGRADVNRVREKTRKRRLTRLILILALIDFYLWYRYLTDNPFKLPTLGPEA